MTTMPDWDGRAWVPRPIIDKAVWMRATIAGRVVRWARRLKPERIRELRDAARKPRPVCRELIVDGVPYGWMPPGWAMPEHRCITVRAPLTVRSDSGITRAYVESDDGDVVHARTWTEQDDANFRARRTA